MVASVLLYGCESWALTRTQLHTLEVFHRCRLRLMLGVRRTRDMSVADLLERCGANSIETLVHCRQLRWLGHVARMAPTRLAKQLLHCTRPGGARRPGRQPPSLLKTYADLVSKYLSRAALREFEDLRDALPRGASWIDLARDRRAYRRVVDTVTHARKERRRA